ncbi:MAG TPA: carboxypeptidase-like regulatory domain-containing protein [Candidatus Acidoferrales bacterium]|nr:carboxypeptidase-like regulatory domain-containing protein [Candidatus Acidoferrales bacterium]
MIPLLLAFFFAPQNQPPEKCSISGTIVNSVTGELLNKVQVLALNAGNAQAAPASTITGAKGEFTLVQLEPGQYRLKAVRNGYLETCYGARRAESNGITLTLEAGQELQDLQLKLLPFAVIAGTVRDPEGEPLAGVSVALLTMTYRGGRQQVVPAGITLMTDDLGQYRIADLPPGRYYVRAALHRFEGSHAPVDHSPKGAPPLETLVPTFHPASRDTAGARRIEVTAGAHFTGADITLLRSRMYRVRVQAEAPAGLGFGVRLHEAAGTGRRALHQPAIELPERHLRVCGSAFGFL